MSIKDILLPMNNASANSHSFDVAAALAEQFDAHVTGLHVNEQPGYEVYGEMVNAGLISALEQQQQLNTEKARKVFGKYLVDRQDKSTFISLQGAAVPRIVRYASFQDLVVVDQHDPASPFDIGSNIPEQITLESGRPTLVVPYIGCRETIGKNILIAWNSKREAVRAVHDAMPFLVKADTVKLLSINQGKQDELGCIEIGEHLARHDVNIEVQQAEVKEMEIADYLLSRAADFESDLLVMGAYGHSRFREYTLGGVTRTILKTMTVPVLISH